MGDSFAFPPRHSADALRLALGSLPGVLVESVAPHYLLEGPRWVVEVRCRRREAQEIVARVYEAGRADWPAERVVLRVTIEPA